MSKLFGLKYHVRVRGGGTDSKDSESQTFAMLPKTPAFVWLLHEIQVPWLDENL